MCTCAQCGPVVTSDALYEINCANSWLLLLECGRILLQADKGPKTKQNE